MKKKPIKIDVNSTIVFLFTGLSLFFPLGLLTLTVGPVRMVSDFAEKENWSESNENLIQKIILVLFFIFTLFLTIKLTRFLVLNKNKNLKYFIYAMLGIGLFTSVFIFSFKPEMLINIDGISHVNKSAEAEFHFGSYPDEEKMEELKEDGYSGVISLLNELVIPAEPILMEKEVINAKKVGIQLISVPMLPWIVENDASVLKIKEIARHFKGKYYVHCYLGKDRANVFRNIIENENKNLIAQSNLGVRSLDEVKRFELGNIIKLKQNVFIVPYPTNEEFFGFILNGNTKTVVSILSSSIKDEKVRIEKEAKIMKQYNQTFVNIPLLETDTDETILKAIEKIKKLQEPMVIHSFKSDSKLIKRFVNLYQSKK
jgi:hypothetical protein